MLNILIPCEYSSSSIYLVEINKCLNSFASTVFDLDKFWGEKGNYQIIYLQWPEALFRWNRVFEIDLRRLENTLTYWKNKCEQIIVTRHNTFPHLLNDSFYKEVYRIVYKYADKIIHLGEYSKNEYESIYGSFSWISGQKHYIVPQPFDYNMCPQNNKKENARKKLKIPSSESIVLVFGSLNRKEDIKLLEYLEKKKDKKYRFLVARREVPRIVGCRTLKPMLKLYVNLTSNSFNNFDFIPNEDVPYYFNAADCVFLPRINILNSAVLYHAFSFGKVVVGPSSGNITEILIATKNPIYDPKDLKSIDDKINMGLNLAKENHGLKNYAYATAHWSREIITSLLKNVIY
jgi:Glycosyltransferase